jgi:hypothetical protein
MATMAIIQVYRIQISAAATKQHKNKMTKPQTNTVSKCCEDNTKSLTLSVHILYIVHTTNSSKMLLHIL